MIAANTSASDTGLPEAPAQRVLVGAGAMRACNLSNLDDREIADEVGDELGVRTSIG